MGAPDELRPRESDIIVSEMDEDFSENQRGAAEIVEPGGHAQAEYDGASGPDYGQGPDFGDEPQNAAAAGVAFDPDAGDYPDDAAGHTARPFQNLPDLPADLAEAFESFKLAILRHKVTGWTEVARDDVLASLDALRQFACAPS